MSKGTQQQIADALKGGSIIETTPNAPFAGSGEVLAANPDRRLLIVENRGANDIHLSFGGTASASTLTLAVGKQLFFEYPAPTNALNALADTADTAMYIAEA